MRVRRVSSPMRMRSRSMSYLLLSSEATGRWWRPPLALAAMAAPLAPAAGGALGDVESMLSGDEGRGASVDIAAGGMSGRTSGSECDTGRRAAGGGIWGGGGEKALGRCSANESGALEELCREAGFDGAPHGPEGVRCIEAERWNVLGERELGDGLE